MEKKQTRKNKQCITKKKNGSEIILAFSICLHVLNSIQKSELGARDPHSDFTMSTMFLLFISVFTPQFILKERKQTSKEMS